MFEEEYGHNEDEQLVNLMMTLMIMMGNRRFVDPKEVLAMQSIGRD